MVDFNNEATVSTPPGEVVKIVVLERREQVIEALEAYYMVESSGAETQHKAVVVRARILALWFQVAAMVKRRIAKQKDAPSYEDLERAITTTRKFEELVAAYHWLNEFIDDMGLTFIDGRARYDRSNVEISNSHTRA